MVRRRIEFGPGRRGRQRASSLCAGGTGRQPALSFWGDYLRDQDRPTVRVGDRRLPGGVDCVVRARTAPRRSSRRVRFATEAGSIPPESFRCRLKFRLNGDARCRCRQRCFRGWAADACGSGEVRRSPLPDTGGHAEAYDRNLRALGEGSESSLHWSGTAHRHAAGSTPDELRRATSQVGLDGWHTAGPI